MSNSEKQKRVTVGGRIPESLKKAFKEKCRKDGVYMTDILESLISKYTKRN